MAKRIASFVHSFNDFPDEILSHIISFLPFREAVRTSVLSRRWRYLFTFLSSLDVEINKNEEEERIKWFMDFVDRFVFYRGIPSIQRFRLRCRNNKLISQRVTDWMFALVWHQIRELELRISCEICPNGLSLPLFSCESLVVLKLHMYWIFSESKIPDRICLPRLKVLHFKECTFPDDGSVERLLSSCPVLEDLVIRLCFFDSWRDVKFSISNQNLKRLELNYLYASYKHHLNILVNAPRLVLLKCCSVDLYFTVFIDMKSLVKVVIDYDPNRGSLFVSAAPDALRWISNFPTLEINFSNLLRLQKEKLQLPLFDKTTCLTIWNWESQFDPGCLEYFLSPCVVLETLVFEVRASTPIEEEDANIEYSMQSSQLTPLLDHLKTIEIRLFDILQAEVLMSVIEFFLKYARVLEELKISSKQGDPEQQVEIVRKFTSFPKASNKCRVFF